MRHTLCAALVCRSAAECQWHSMRKAAHGVCGILWAALLVLTLGGCAAWQEPIAKELPPEVAQKRQDRNAAAIQDFEAARSTAEYKAAVNRYTEGDTVGCREMLERLLARNPKHRDGRLLMTEICLTANDPQGALSSAQQAVAAWPQDGAVQYAMGLSLDAAGRPAEAAAYYARARQIDPSNEVYAASYQVAENGAPQTLPTGAANPTFSARPLDAEQTAHSEPPTDDRSETKGLMACLKAAEQALAQGVPDAAFAAFQQAQSLRPEDPQVSIAAAVASLRHNQPDLAIRLLSPAAQRFPECASVHRTLGAAYYRRGDFRSAQLALRQALSLDKSNALAYFLMGNTLAKLGQEGAAATYLRQAQLLDPRYAGQQ